MKYKLKHGVQLPIHPNYSGLHPRTWSKLNGGEAVELTAGEAENLKSKIIKNTGTGGSNGST